NAVPATPTITANPGFTACTSTTLSGSITSGVTYQWNLGGSPITGATNNTYAATASGTYTQTVKNASNCTATSASQTVTINAVPATPTITANPGFTACTSTTLSGSITSGVTYQWNLGGSPITGATNNTYAATASGTYTQTITNASNCSATSASQTVTINAVPATPTVTNGSTCGTGTVILSASGSQSTYNWYAASSGGVSLATTASFLTPSISSTTTYYVTAVSAAGCESAPRTSVVATVNPLLPVSISIAPSSNPVCSGILVTFTATPTNGGASPTYQWQVNGTNVGTNSATYTSSSFNNNDAVTCILTSNATCPTGSPATSSTTTMMVNAKPTVTTSGNAIICNGLSTTLTATPSGGTSPYTYAWSPSAGLSAITVQSPVASPTSTTTYSVTATDANNCTSSAATATVTVNAALAAGSVGSSQTICSGFTPATLAQITGASGGGALSYLWQTSPDNSTWSTASTSSGPNNGINYTSPAITSTTYYRREVSSTVCPSTPVFSSSVQITVNTLPAAPAVTNGSTCGTGTVTLSASGSPTTYNWYAASSGGSSLVTTASYTTPSISVTTTYYVTAVSATGCESAPRTAVVATVNALPTAPTVTNGSRCGTGTVVLSATGSPTTYNWYAAVSGGISLATTTSYTTPSISTTTTYYVTTVSVVGCESAPRTAVVATVNPNLPVSVTIAPSSNPICSGTLVTFTAAPTNGGSSPSYQWQVNGSNVGTNSTTYSSTSFNNNDAVTCILTSNATCATGSPATSPTTTMTVNPNLPVSVTIAPSSNPICNGTSVTFTAIPTNGGSSPSYQWQVNSSNVGTNSSTYTSSSFNNNDQVI